VDIAASEMKIDRRKSAEEHDRRVAISLPAPVIMITTAVT